MSDFSAFRGRMNAGGNDRRESFMNSTKRQVYNYIMNSPSRRTVDEMELVEQADKTFKLMQKESKYSIVSDKETFYKRTILFLPDEGVRLGSYLQYDNKTYLTLDISDVDGYPQAFVDFCNFELLIEGEETRVEVDRDPQGRPIYENIRHDYSIPSVATSKIYSTLDNSQMPLPVGALYVYIPYHEKINVPINYEFDMYGDTYQITSAPKVNLLKDENGELYGYLEIRGQRKDETK